jgi:HD superfamily phosphohydrolase/RIO-like serine/threonine protein kinase
MADEDERTYGSDPAETEEQPAALQLTVGRSIDGVHTILDKKDPHTVPTEDTGQHADPLGSGGSGTVYLASYRGMQLRAIKFLTLNYLSGDTGQHASDFQSVFNRERVFLSTLSQGNIARLHDFGTFKDPHDVEWQYIVTDYIEGQELRPMLESGEATHHDVYRLICHVLHAVEYMHSRRVLHADVKWENIKCRKSLASPEAVVLDLGTAHHVPEDNSEEQGRLQLDASARVRFITTRRILHAKHREYRGRVVDKEAIQELFPDHDIHAIGVLLQELTARPAIADKFRDEIGQEGLAALQTMISNIKDSPVTHYYKSVRQLHNDWHKLRRTYLAPVGVPELSLAAEFKYSVPTSAGRGVVTPRLSELVNHKLFQRLRRVPQLEMTLIKYPGATHSRYAHSMAVLRNARYYLAHLLNDTNFRLLAEQPDLQATLLLALLHDVGHYQLSHMFEDYASNQRGDNRVGPWEKIDFDIPSDDDLFWSVVDPETESPLRGKYGERIQNAWRNSEDKLGVDPAPSIADMIRDEFKPETYEAMLRIHHAIYQPRRYSDIKDVHRVLGAVLSSDIDADKVSYLIEDSSRSGVNYGSGVDFDGLLGALRMPSLDDIGNRPTLGITQIGLAAAQSIAVSRNLMVGQVYWHHNNRAATAMIKYVIARLLHRGQFSMPDFIEDTLFLEYEATLLYLFNKFQASRQGNEVNPIAGILEGERRVYKTAFSTARLDRETGEHIGAELTKKRFDEIIQLEKDLTEVVRQALGMRDIRDGEVLVDVPLKERERPAGERGGHVVVYNSRLATTGKDLRSYTPFLTQIKEQHIRENRVCRVFVSPRIASTPRYSSVVNKIAEIMEEKYGI